MLALRTIAGVMRPLFCALVEGADVFRGACLLPLASIRPRKRFARDLKATGYCAFGDVEKGCDFRDRSCLPCSEVILIPDKCVTVHPRRL